MVRSQWAAAFLVAADLVWVMGTGALDRFTATILAVLVAAAPFSARFPRGRTWNGFWNAALALAFLLLLQRVIGSGTDGLLGGGVLLAMACQIHLLHVGSGEKRGDLLTFNSVLIALVAGQAGRIEGFTPFAALWGAALVTFLIAEADPRGRRARHAFRRTLAPAAVLAAGTLGLATLVPSDLRIHDPVEPGALGFVGQTDIQPEARIDLRQFRPPADEDAVLFRIAPRTGSPADVPAHWREAVLEHQDGSRFLHVHRIERDAPLGVESFPDGRGRIRRPTGPAAARVTVEIVEHRGPLLPAPLEIADVSIPLDGFPEMLHATGDGVLRRPAPAAVPRASLGYELGIARSVPPVAIGSPADRAPYLRVDVESPAAVPPAIHDLIRAALRGAPDDVAAMEVVQRCRDHLAAGLAYARPDEDGAAADFEAFLGAQGGGHCEYFATALALMLRLRGVPCRIVTGYLVHEWQADAASFVVRARDAHAWVEVLDVAAGAWRTVDATPAATTGPSAPRGPQDLLLLTACGLLVGIGLIRRSRAPVEHEAARRYRRAVRRTGLRRAPHETPRELLARAATAIDVRPDHLEALRRATAEHERARFSASTEEALC